MSYGQPFTISDLSTAVQYFQPNGEHTWDTVLSWLDKGPLQLTTSVGVLELVERGNDSEDSYGDYSSYAILKVSTTWPKSVRHFRLKSDTSSFGGVYYSDLEEVQAVPVTATKWETL